MFIAFGQASRRPSRASTRLTAIASKVVAFPVKRAYTSNPFIRLQARGRRETMCKTFPFFGPKRGHDAITKIQELHEDRNKSNKETINWFYSVLNILDAKANSLLRVNGLFITILVVFWGAARTAGNPLKITHDQTATAVLALIIVLVSTIFCFWIVRVNWKFLGKVVKVRANIENQQGVIEEREVYDFKSEAERLAKVVDDRTHYYWIGWLFTFAVVVLPVLLWLQWMPQWLLEFLKTHVPPPG
jgi:hypothetical protein